MAIVEYTDMTLARASEYASEEDKALIEELFRRIESVREEQDLFIQLCDRFDKLYLAEDFTRGGADLWPADASATAAGLSHISVNLPATYVDVPAALQAQSPIENMLASDTTPEARTAAAAWERVRTAWKRAEEHDLKLQKATVVKGLYGRTAAFVYWDKDLKRPCYSVVEQPRNLYLGYGSDNYTTLEWAALVNRMEPNAVLEKYGVEVTARDAEGASIPYVTMPGTFYSEPSRSWLRMGSARVEVWDYWYRKPVWKGGKFLRMATWNAVLVGNMVVRGPTEYKEYKGQLPYVPLFNTFIPGVPTGRSELYDVEPLIREMMERITSGSQAIASATGGDFWQLVGPEAPNTASGLKPQRNTVIAPGAGNRIEVIAPFIAQFQLEQHLTRIDRSLAIISGLNDLLLGLAPSQVLNSSKAINALVSNYEARLSMRRALLYTWLRKTWELVVDVYVAKDKDVKSIYDAGAGLLEIIDPSLNPRDELETATKAANLVNAKLWSQVRAMDAVGVDDPETEQDLIREESTDATLFPERTQVMAQLLAVLQSLGLQAPEGAQAQAQGQATSGTENLRQALGAATPTNPAGGPGPGGAPEAMGQTPPIPGAPPEAGGPQPFIQGPAGGVGLAQTMLQNGQAKSRILTQQQLGKR